MSHGNHNSRYWIILLLGSYDPNTEKILENLRNKLTEEYMGLDNYVIVLLLNRIEVYAAELINKKTFERKRSPLIVERFASEKKLSLYFINPDYIDELIDIPSSDISLEDQLIRYLENDYEINEFRKLDILPKLEHLATISSSIFVIRHEELTRGGEYVELVYLLYRQYEKKIFFVKKDGIALSTMAWEILDFHGVNLRPYVSEEDLLNRIKGIFSKIVHGSLSK